MLVSSVQQVVVCSAVLCIVRSFAMFVVDTTRDHIVDAYSNIGLVKVVYVENNISL